MTIIKVISVSKNKTKAQVLAKNNKGNLITLHVHRQYGNNEWSYCSGTIPEIDLKTKKTYERKIIVPIKMPEGMIK